MLTRYLIGLILSLSLSAATVGSLRIHSSTVGKGPRTVILVHGWTCDESAWTEQVPALAGQYRVVTLDLPGHGKSDLPKDGRFSMDLFANAIEAVRSEVNADRVVLVGHSMGTPVVLRYARLYPQHTIALVFVDGEIHPDQNAQGSMSRQFAAKMGGPDGRKNRANWIRGTFSPSTTPSMQTRILNMMLSAPEATAVGAMNAAFEPSGYTTGIPKVPVLGIYPGPSPTETRETLQARFPNSEYALIPGTGHFLMIEKPTVFNSLLLNFLAKQKF